MQTIALIGEDGRPVCEECEVADTPFARMKGLLGRDVLPERAGMLIHPCWAVHTFFMRFPIDVVFVDRDLRVVDVVSLCPWRSALRRGAHSALELPAGAAARRGIVRGDRLAWGSSPGGAA